MYYNSFLSKVKVASVAIALFLAGCGKDEDAKVALKSIKISPETEVTLAIEGTQKFAATPEPADATDVNIKWDVSNPQVISVADNGLVTANAVGEATVWAASGNVQSKKVTVKVTLKALTSFTVAPTELRTLTLGDDPVQLVVTKTPADAGGSFTYESGNDAVVTVSADGLVTVVGEGSTNITVTSGSLTPVVVPVTVSLPALTSFTVTPDPITLTLGDAPVQLVVTKTPSNAGGAFTYESGDDAVVTVSAAGLVTVVGTGNTSITVTSGSLTPVVVPVTVSLPALISFTVTPDQINLQEGDEPVQLVVNKTPPDAGGSFTYTTGNDAVVTVSTAGLVTVVGTGSTNITVTSGSLTPVEVSVTVEAASLGRKVFSLSDLETGSTANDLMFSWGSSLVHRTTEGTLDVFDMTGTKTGTLLGDASAVPWSGMRDIIFCPPNVLITAASSNGDLGLFTLSGNQATLVAPAFGGGFGFPVHLPFTNVFYSIGPADPTHVDAPTQAGQLYRWNFHTDGTWADGYAALVETSGNEIYDPVCSWNDCAVIGVTADGKLWRRLVGFSGHGTIGGWIELGSGGWNRYVRIFGIGTSLLCLDAEGFFWLYEDFNTTGPWEI